MPGVVNASLLANRGTRYFPGDTSIVIPSNVTRVQIWIQAAGGAGFGRTPVNGSAGGGGGFSYITRTVLSGEWGTSLTIAVGAGSSGNNGGNTTLSGTMNGSAVSVTCNGGSKGSSVADGSGGTASGGDTNVSGGSGSGYVAGPPGEEAPGTPGKCGGYGFPGAIFGDLFGAGDGAISSSTSQPGFDGYILAIWS